MALSPRESGKFIARMAKHVFIEDEGIKNLSSVVLERLIEQNSTQDPGFGLSTDFSQYDFHPKADNPKAIDWIFLLDTLNFSFWSPSSERKWKVNGQTGYFALCAAIKRAIDEKVPITSPNYYGSITNEELARILRGDDPNYVAPMIEERVKNLQEVGKILVEKYNSTFVNFVQSCNGSAEELLKKIVNEFECYRDEADFHGTRVSFYKRAQILIGDIWACFRGKDVGEFKDIDKITMFADYRIPQVLLHFGAMRYSNPLLSALQTGTELLPGSLEEIEIRGCSIEVVERVVDFVRGELRKCSSSIDPSKCNAIRVDHFLWDYRRDHVEEMDRFPFHKIRTIYY
ncbi:queuosine salvage protein [Venturia canescens]|uniref:queuosine salvage protein n=1 Tax=Venturia canescens TaxID=32260 RepID=UPI001C9C5C3A|nr:queuosine salvage protein [Venturia canescens]XP_043277233.1 queuosine salvage protein [Venturia canescens]